ncbi:MAG: putative O-methyltransferase [Acidimicrobiales bacterium]|nr:putative O-methyltransferase [Acidimicrobiales bacterium]
MTDAAEAYLDLLKRVITRYRFDPPYRMPSLRTRRGRALQSINKRLAPLGVGVLQRYEFDPLLRKLGWDQPWQAESMIGTIRMDNLHDCVRTALSDGVPGDLMETGVWRGGAVIFMRGCLRAYGDETRKVWVADSFEGLPPPSGKYADDASSELHEWDHLAVSVEQVKANFERYGLLDDRVQFIKGWFKDTLPTAPVEQLAVLRLDGDMYESTIDALTHLYPKLSPGGFLIVDDYGVIPACDRAVDDYRAAHDITEPFTRLEGIGIYWRKAA